jgi:hypothetical protein
MAMTDPLAQARALAAVLSVTELPHPGGSIAWTGDSPTPPASPDRRGPAAVAEALTEYLLDALPGPLSQTHRLRVIRDFVGRGPVSRRDLLCRHASSLVRFDHLAPTYRLEDVRRWRAFCQYGDEEVYVAAAVAGALADSRLPPGNRESVLARVLAGWRVFIQPADPDFRHLVGRGLHEAHVHLGELPPAPVLWRLLMARRYTPVPADPAWLVRDRELTALIDTRTRLLRDLVGGDHVRVHLGDEWLRSSVPDGTDPPAFPDYVRHYLMAERELLVRGLLGIPAGGRPGPLAAELEAAFWGYVAARMRFMRAIVHPGRGFEAFARNRGLAYGGREDQVAGVRMASATVRPTVGHLLDSHVQRADIRFALRDKFGGITAQMGRVAEVVGAGGHGIDWRCIVAFSRGKAYQQDRDFGRRPARWRAYRRQVTAKTVTLLNMVAGRDRWPPEPFTALGIDMISSEYGFDAGVVAPAYELTRPGRAIDPRHLDWARAGDRPRLIRCYHTGEDREHPVTAARATWEAVTWLGLGARDRVAHLTYLADPSAEYAIEETAGERLDNLTWLFHLWRTSEVARPTGLPTDWLVTELARVSDRVHRSLYPRPTAEDLIAAWELRPLEEDRRGDPANPRADVLYPELPPGVLYALLGYAGTDGLWGTEERPLANVDRAAADELYRARGVVERGDYPAAAVAAATAAVRALVLDHGVDLETCPTSNQLIGSELSDPPPGTAFLDSVLATQVLIGTDDPSMFKTDLAVEAAILVGSLLDRGVARSEVFARVSRIIWRPDLNAGG